MLTAAAARAEEVTIVSGVLGPEGPLFVDGNLYFVAWTSGTLSKWDGKNTTVLNSQPGCSHNGLALTKQKTFLLACTDDCMARSSNSTSRASSCAAGTPMTRAASSMAASTTSWSQRQRNRGYGAR